MSSIGQILRDFVPATPIAKALWTIRQQIEAAGGANESVEDLMKELRLARGYDD